MAPDARRHTQAAGGTQKQRQATVRSEGFFQRRFVDLE